MKCLALISLAAAFMVGSASIVARADGARYSDPAFGFSFVYPDAWHPLTWPDDPGLVILRNFDQLLHGGNVPSGGAEIAVRTLPPYPPNWSASTDEYLELHALAACTGTIISETSRSSGAPARVKWTSQTASGTVSTTIRTVIRLGGRMFVLGVEYQASDPAGPQYEQVLSDLIGSLSISAATPAGTPVPMP